MATKRLHVLLRDVFLSEVGVATVVGHQRDPAAVHSADVSATRRHGAARHRQVGHREA